MTAVKRAAKKAAAKKAPVKKAATPRKVPTDAQLAQVANDYLLEKRCVLYARSFDIVSAGGRAAAVAFLAQAYRDLDERLNTP